MLGNYIQKPLTIIEAKGGLGNQLFQLAAGLVRTRNDLSNLYFNISYYRHDSRHGGFFLKKMFPQIQFNLTEARSFNIPTATFRLDDLADIDPGQIIDFRYPAYISGYFQNSAFISPAIDYMQTLFLEARSIYNKEGEAHCRPAPLTTTERRIIGVHLRRGDYVGDKNYGVPRLTDVLEAIDAERRLHTEAESQVVVFSDASEVEIGDFVATLGGVQYVTKTRSGKVDDDISEFIAMSKCNSLVCANSTFSYWAGVLSPSIERFWIPTPWMRSGAVKTENLISNKRARVYQCELI